MRRVLMIVFSLGAISSCHVANRIYNPSANVLPYRPPPVPPASIVTVECTPLQNGACTMPVPQQPFRTDRPDPNCDPLLAHPCLAFLEFDELGEMWDRSQLGKALDLIDKAKRANTPPIVVTFLHGWKNNADDRDRRQNHNVTAFESVLEFLKMPAVYPNHPVVGIYISWRGDLVPPYWPARRLLSYFNREDAAIRIPGPSMTAALTQIMLRTHASRPDAFLAMVGHSFGGLALERALSQAMTDYVLRKAGVATDGDGAWADLVVLVNSAASATEGKQMLDFLKEHQVKYVSPVPPAQDVLGRTPDRPLLLSISSLGDAATRFAVPIGHGPSFLAKKLKGSWRNYGNQADPPGVTLQSAYYLSTTAHMAALQSHFIVDMGDPNDRARCGANPKFFIDPALVSSPNYPIHGSTGKAYEICENPTGWNKTPYWAMEMPATIVPDHSGIFNTYFVGLLSAFLLDPAHMANAALRPTLTAQ